MSNQAYTVFVFSGMNCNTLEITTVIRVLWSHYRKSSELGRQGGKSYMLCSILKHQSNYLISVQRKLDKNLGKANVCRQEQCSLRWGADKSLS